MLQHQADRVSPPGRLLDSQLPGAGASDDSSRSRPLAKGAHYLAASACRAVGPQALGQPSGTTTIGNTAPLGVPRIASSLVAGTKCRIAPARQI
jgi:hypothetical protein